jgi:hemolysin activation/secretion protein
VAFALAAAMALVLATPAQAQGRAGSSAADPSVATQRIERLEPPRPEVRRPVAPTEITTGVPEERPGGIPLPSDETPFLVKKIRFEGNTRVRTEELEKLAKPYEGRNVTLGELNILARRVRVRYRVRGYPVADATVPVQSVEDGVVRLVVSEGRYGAVSVRGNKHYESSFVQRLFRPATVNGLVHAPPLYQSLLLLNEYPDLSVQAQFNPGKQPGTTDVVLNVKDSRPAHISLDYNNFGNRSVGRNRAGVTLLLGNVFAGGDEASLRIVEPWPSRSDLAVNGGYVVPIGARGTKLGYQFANIETRATGGALTALDIRGDAEIHTLAAVRPLRRTFRELTNFSTALAFKTIRNTALGALLSDDRIRTLSFTHDGARADRKGRWVHAVNVSQGLGTALGGNPNGDPLSSRAGAGSSFTKTNVDVLRTQDLKKNRYLLVKFSSQTSTRPLPVAELFGIGGPDSVRGFIQSEFVCEDGFSLGGEYRQQVWQSKSKKNVAQGVGFVDYGYGSLKRPQVGERGHRSLTGVGLGVRAGFGLNTSLRADVGFPISSGRNVDGDEATLYAQAATRF